MKVNFSRIVWDTDGEKQKVKLPTSVSFDNIDNDKDIEEEGAGMLSDEFGWCVKSFLFEIHDRSPGCECENCQIVRSESLCKEM